MTTARRTVEDPNGDITVLVDSVDLGDGAGDAPYVKLVSGTESSTELLPGTAADGLLVNLGANNDTVPGSNVAAEDGDSGNPIKVGGRYSATPPVYTDGDRTNLQVGSRGSVNVTLLGSNSGSPLFPNAAAIADTFSNPTVSHVGADLMGYNGTNWDRLRSDTTNGLDVDVTRVTGTVTTGGVAAEGVATSGNPVLVAGRAESTVPTAVDDGDVVTPWNTVEGARVVTFNRTRTAALTPTVDTAVYADLDRLGSVVTVSGAGLRNGGSGMIVGASLVDAALSNFSIEAFFFQVTPTLANADNGIWDLSDANMLTAGLLGGIDFWSANSKTHTSGRFAPGTYLGGPVALHYTCASGDSAIYMSLRARGAYDAVGTTDLTLYLELLRY